MRPKEVVGLNSINSCLYFMRILSNYAVPKLASEKTDADRNARPSG